MTAMPQDAEGTYENYQGKTWVKDIEHMNPQYTIATVWSLTSKRWRKRREWVRAERIVPIELLPTES